jgi:cell division septation protein DedD
MTELRTYEFGADLETLRRSGETGVYPAGMEPALRAMVSELISRVRERPRAVYVCSPDRDAEARDRFAFLITKLVREHVPTAILVDCAFLSVGLSGIIPHRDALGFLDLLLYGTSLGVITQEAQGGVMVVGAGSFAVTKKSPFVMDAFTAARRYLVNQAKCALFVGPLTDDGDNLHPVAQNVDLAILLRAGDRFGGRALDPHEEKIATARGVEAWSVRVNTRAAATAAPESAPMGGRTETRPEPTLVAGARDFVEKSEEVSSVPRDRGFERPAERRAAGPSAAATMPRGPRPSTPMPPPRARGRSAELEELDRLDSGRRAGGSRIVRLIASIVALVVVAFVVWWFYMTRSVRDRGEEHAAAGGPQPEAVQPSPRTTADSTSVSTETATSASGPTRLPPAQPDTTAAATQRPSSGASTRVPEIAPREDSTSRSAPAAAEKRFFESTADSIYSAESLSEFADRYIIHVSSFRGRQKAKEEAFYLLGWGYPVFMYHVDLGSKGMWYRVYVGPYDTRDEAMQHKIKLDENPRIQSTRISKVPG